MDNKMYLVNEEKVDRVTARKIVEDECERQWNENQAEEYGEWCQQDDETKSVYYKQMWANLVRES